MMFLLIEPKVKAVKNPDREEDRTSKEETPGRMTKAEEDVCEPCCEASQSN
jgi:hypothetical protein